MKVADPSVEGAEIPTKPKGWVWLVLKIAISAVILLGLLWRFRNDIPSLSTIDHWAAVKAIALLLLQPLLIGSRWWLLLRQYESPSRLGTLTAVTWVSVFANQFLPAGVGGDAVRIVYARKLGNRLGAATASVLMDRMMALVALALLILILVPQLPQAIDRRIFVALGVACVLAVATLIAMFAYVRRTSGAARWPLVQRVLHLVFYVLRTFQHPAAMTMAILLSVAVHILSFAAFLVIVRGLAIDVAVPPFLAVSALLTFIQIMPISIGGWGVREMAAVSLLGLLGIEPGPALLASVLLGVCYAAASLPGAVLWPFLSASRSKAQ
jgi:uncharacterized protein (TIRG00374 family)